MKCERQHFFLINFVKIKKITFLYKVCHVRKFAFAFFYCRHKNSKYFECFLYHKRHFAKREAVFTIFSCACL